MIISSISHPIVINTAILSATLIAAWFGFWYKTNLARTERERAYVCTLLSSSITSIFSLPLVYQLLTNGGDLSEILAYRTWTVIVTTFFMTFLVMDLAIGIVFYRNKIELLTGWVHHITYFGTLTWAIHNQYSAIFIMMCVLELPTFLLALGSVRSQLRRDYLFASAFLITRILFHAYAIKCAWNIKPFGPIVNALSAFFPLHCFWFYGFIQQQIRLAKKNKNVTTTATISTKTSKTAMLEKEQATINQSITSVLNSQERQNFKPLITKVTTIKRTLVNKITSKRSPAAAAAAASYSSPSSSFHQRSPPVSVH